MIRTRIAPSPTGLFHIGTLRTGLFNYLFSKRNGGQCILRIEDTDIERSKKDYEENIIKGFYDMGIVFDEDPIKGGEYAPYRQSERAHTYRKYLEELLRNQKAYYCYCSKEELDLERIECEKKKLPPRYSGKCRHLSEEDKLIKQKENPNPVIRLLVPDNTDVEFYDLIRGNQKQNTKDLTGDFIIAKDLDTSLYNFTVVVDDYLMKITHVMRGEDHISNTPKQVLIYNALNIEIPKFAHFPLILNPDKTKLSKRKNPVTVDDFLNQGYLKEGLINFLALLGWNPGTEKEIYTLEELIQDFSIEKINKSGAIFDMKRLDWINGEHIKKLSKEDFAKKCIPYLTKENLLTEIFSEKGITYKISKTDEIVDFEKITKLVSHEQQRIKKMSEIVDNIKFFFTNELIYPVDLLFNKQISKEQALFSLKELIPIIEKDETFSEESLKENILLLIAKYNLKNGDVLWPMRASLTGQEKSPGAFECAYIIGKTKTLERIKKAIFLLNEKD